jgi:ribonuclease PH
MVAAVSVGVVEGTPLLDLCYDEDSRAEVDFNIVMTDGDEFVELQGTAEGLPFSVAAMHTLVDLGRKGIRELLAAQRAAIAGLEA